MLKIIDLFCGIGGISLGFKQASDLLNLKLKTVFASEIDKFAVKTYIANHDVQVHGDIHKIKSSDIPDHHILLAGFPCQAFSIAGNKLGFEDTRGTLFFEVARIVKEKQPKVVFCENVKNLKTHDKGKTIKVITSTLEELGYSVFIDVLNSKDFGVPQNRERVYIVAFHKTLNVSEFEFPKHNLKSALKDILEDKVQEKYYLSQKYLDFLENHKKRHKQKGNGFGYQIKSENDIANTLVCGGMGIERNLVQQNGIRRLTPRECARLQGFPDSFKFVVSDTQLYKQFGNSVTVPVIKAIALEILKLLEKI